MRPEPPSLEKMPLEIRCKIMSYLGQEDQQQAAEASRALDAAVPTQYESTTDFRIQHGKKILVMVVNEGDCRRALMQAVKYYQQIHVMLAAAVVSRTSGDLLKKIIKWLKRGTRNGRYPVTTIEIPGPATPDRCGCIFGRLFRYCENLIIAVDIPKKMLLEIAENADHTHRGRRLVYKGMAKLRTLAVMARIMKPDIEILTSPEGIDTEGVSVQEVADWSKTIGLIPVKDLLDFCPGHVFAMTAVLKPWGTAAKILACRTKYDRIQRLHRIV